MRSLILAATIILITPLLANAKGERFDLVCTGENLDPSNGVITSWPSGHPWKGRIQVDLIKKEFCDQCTAPEPIAEVLPDKILFRTGEHRELVTRDLGVFQNFDGNPGEFVSIHATCEKAPFTGMPKTLF